MTSVRTRRNSSYCSTMSGTSVRSLPSCVGGLACLSASVKICEMSGALSITVRRGSPTITGAHFCQWSDVVVSRARIYLSSSQPCATRGCPVRAVETPLGRGLDADQRLGSALSGGSAKSRPRRADRRPRPPASAAPLFAEHKWLKFRSNYGQTPGVGQITARPLAYRAIVALKRSGAEGARQSQAMGAFGGA